MQQFFVPGALSPRTSDGSVEDIHARMSGCVVQIHDGAAEEHEHDQGYPPSPRPSVGKRSERIARALDANKLRRHQLKMNSSCRVTKRHKMGYGTIEQTSSTSLKSETEKDKQLQHVDGEDVGLSSRDRNYMIFGASIGVVVCLLILLGMKLLGLVDLKF